MAEIGKATLTVVPKLTGLDASVKSAFSKVDAESIGAQVGSRYSSGIVKSGAVAGAFAAVTSKAMSSVSSHVDAAISRFDTLNNYPKVMESLGYGAEAAEASIGKMNDRLQGLPTALDSMVSLTQGLVVNTNDLTKATDGALALNDMLLASGSNQQLVNSAMEQFRQILSKGKPEMQDWRSLTTAMPGQMDQLAKSMLGPTANANDLYRALGGGMKPGDGDPLFTMDQMLDAIIRLDTEGGEGFASFRSQAEQATGGVATSMANMGTAITRGLAGTLDAIGKDNIAGFFSTMKGDINDAFGTINGIVQGAMPAVTGFMGAVRDLAPALIAAGGANLVFGAGASKASSVIGAAKGRIDAYSKSCAAAGKSASVLGKGIAAIGGPMAIASAAITVGAGVIGFIADNMEKAKVKEENFTKATTGLLDAVSNAAALDEYKGKIDGIGQSSGISALGVDELAESAAKMVDSMNERHAEAENQIGILSTAQQIIRDSVGDTDLSAEAQGRLEWALKQVNEQFGLNISAQDVVNGYYKDQEDNVKDLTQSIDELIEAKKREIQENVIAEDYSDAIKHQRDTKKTLAAEYDKVDWAKVDEYKALRDQASEEGNSVAFNTYETRLKNLTKSYDDAKAAADSADAAVDELGKEMADQASETKEAADAFDAWGRTLDDSFKFLADSNGGFDNLIGDMRDLGVNTDALKDLEQEDLMAIAKTYDGTKESLVNALSGIDGALSETALNTYGATQDIVTAFKEMGLTPALEEMGVSIYDFAAALNEAGYKADDLKNISQEDFAAMAAACGGDIQQMISAIAMYNAEPLIDKDGTIRMDDTSLIDAQGNLYTWNNGVLLDKSGEAVMDVVQLMDAQGSVVEWNGSKLEMLESTAEVEHSSVWDAVAAIQSLNNQDWSDRSKIVTIDYRMIQSGSPPAGAGVATGGIRLNAAGGIRYHADGAIARKAVPLDIVGEDGAEAIVPLTNRKYSQPFVDLIAEGIKEKGIGNGTERIAELLELILAAMSKLRLEMDGKAVGSAVLPYIDERLGEMSERSERGF